MRPLAALLPFLRPYKKQIALALLFLLLAAAATLALPAAIKSVVDNGFAIDVSDPGARLAAVRSQFLLFIPLALAIAVFTASRYFMMSWLGERVTADLRSAVYSHVLRQSPQFFETLKTGEVLSRLTTDTTVIQSAVGSSVSMGLRNLVLFAGSL
ncbi:MAG: ABC transporter transmembrane domain-containing protein, partial [Burkholderiaceae bacterium]